MSADRCLVLVVDGVRIEMKIPLHESRLLLVLYNVLLIDHIMLIIVIVIVIHIDIG